MKKILIALFIISTSIFSIACNKSTSVEPSNNSTPYPVESNHNDTTSNKITIDQAKDIALKHAKLENNKVTFLKAEESIENGINIYDIEFYNGNTEYDYEINSYTGEIIEFDKDIEKYNIQSNQSNTSTKAPISEDEARNIALKHANLTSSDVRFDKIEYEFDNGFNKYDIEFYHDFKEYNYEIDAQTGKILSYEIDR